MFWRPEVRSNDGNIVVEQISKTGPCLLIKAHIDVSLMRNSGIERYSVLSIWMDGIIKERYYDGYGNEERRRTTLIRSISFSYSPYQNYPVVGTSFPYLIAPWINGHSGIDIKRGK